MKNLDIQKKKTLLTSFGKFPIENFKFFTWLKPWLSFSYKPQIIVIYATNMLSNVFIIIFIDISHNLFKLFLIFIKFTCYRIIFKNQQLCNWSRIWRQYILHWLRKWLQLILVRYVCIGENRVKPGT